MASIETLVANARRWAHGSGLGGHFELSGSVVRFETRWCFEPIWVWCIFDGYTAQGPQMGLAAPDLALEEPRSLLGSEDRTYSGRVVRGASTSGTMSATSAIQSARIPAQAQAGPASARSALHWLLTGASPVLARLDSDSSGSAARLPLPGEEAMAQLARVHPHALDSIVQWDGRRPEALAEALRELLGTFCDDQARRAETLLPAASQQLAAVEQLDHAQILTIDEEAAGCEVRALVSLTDAVMVESRASSAAKQQEAVAASSSAGERVEDGEEKSSGKDTASLIEGPPALQDGVATALLVKFKVSGAEEAAAGRGGVTVRSMLVCGDALSLTRQVAPPRWGYEGLSTVTAVAAATAKEVGERWRRRRAFLQCLAAFARGTLDSPGASTSEGHGGVVRGPGVISADTVDYSRLVVWVRAALAKPAKDQEEKDPSKGKKKTSAGGTRCIPVAPLTQCWRPSADDAETSTAAAAAARASSSSSSSSASSSRAALHVPHAALPPQRVSAMLVVQLAAGFPSDAPSLTLRSLTPLPGTLAEPAVVQSDASSLGWQSSWSPQEAAAKVVTGVYMRMLPQLVELLTPTDELVAGVMEQEEEEDGEDEEGDDEEGDDEGDEEENSSSSSSGEAAVGDEPESKQMEDEEEEVEQQQQQQQQQTDEDKDALESVEQPHDVDDNEAKESED